MHLNLHFSSIQTLRNSRWQRAHFTSVDGPPTAPISTKKKKKGKRRRRRTDRAQLFSKSAVVTGWLKSNITAALIGKCR